MQRLLTFIALLNCSFAVRAQVETITPLEPISSPYLMKLTGGLILVVALIFLFAWLLKKFNFNQHSQNGLIRIIAGLSMGTRDRIVLLQIGEEQILLGLTPGRIQKLHTLSQPLDAVSEAPGSAFADKLQRLMGDRKAS